MDTEIPKMTAGKKRKFPVIPILLAVSVLLSLWFFVVSPRIFSNKILPDIYPNSNFDRGIQGKDYVPDLPLQAVAGQKAVCLFRVTKQSKTFRSYPVDWSCNSKYVPASYKTNNPDEVRYVVYINQVRDSVGRYTNNGNAIEIDFYVSIIDRTTGEILADKTFRGGSPASSISSGQSGSTGSKPSPNKVVSWVDSILP